MKKVLFVATVGGFIPQFELNDVRILRELGCEIHYAANFENKMYSYDEDTFEKNGIIAHQTAMAKSPFKLLQNRKACKALRVLIDRQEIDVVHCHTPVGGMLGRIAAYRSKRKPKVVYTAHGFHFYKGAPLFNWCTYYLVERLLARITDVIITINQEDYLNAKKFRLRKSGRVYKIPGVGLDLDRFAEQSTDKPDIKKENTGFNLVTIGELNKNKNHQVVIEAIKKLGRDDIYYSIYGRGAYEEYISELIKKSGMEKYIRLKGYTSCPEKILAGADCFVFPSRREGLGMAALEAMACGLPVIANDNRGTREYMEDGYNGIVCCFNDSDEYARAIAMLADSKAFREQMSENAIKTARKYGIEKTDKIMQSVYNTLILEK